MSSRPSFPPNMWLADGPSEQMATSYPGSKCNSLQLKLDRRNQMCHEMLDDIIYFPRSHLRGKNYCTVENCFVPVVRLLLSS
eukprot:scaffold181321_cov73-Attheya_sp.AAC.2